MTQGIGSLGRNRTGQCGFEEKRKHAMNIGQPCVNAEGMAVLPLDQKGEGAGQLLGNFCDF